VEDDVEDMDNEDDAEIEGLDDMKRPRQTLAEASDDNPVNVDVKDE